MSTPTPRRRAERPASRSPIDWAHRRVESWTEQWPERWTAWKSRAEAVGRSRVPLFVWVGIVMAGTAMLVCAMVPVGPEWFGGVGSVAVSSAYVWGLAVRTGGRPVVFGCLALAMGITVLVLDRESLRTGAAVLTCVVTAVLAVMATVPAVRLRHAAREATYATGLAAIGSLAVVGFEPVITLARFEYTTLALALLGAFGVVYRLGAGLHGLGRRGTLTVVIGAALLAVTLAYAELLREYGTEGVVSTLFDAVGWTRTHLGAFPRPIETLLGIPALAWGCHMRARRRQGWWVCAFGVAATASVSQALLNPSVSLLESGLSVLYGLAVGLVLGFLVIRTDLALTGPRGARARRAEEAAAVRPEPRRTRALL
ncbi:hypothetical protein [Nocardioides sp.]|uniref:hypothetical protein n=1 Tax=Nocardioides sp. TaxID=35761 RepID=UPI00356B54AB